jgi:hypothetical protein
MPLSSTSVPRRMNSPSTMFLVLSQLLEGPPRYRLLVRLETMPSSPSSAACLKNRVPSQSAWSLNWIGERGSGSISLRRKGMNEDS